MTSTLRRDAILATLVVLAVVAIVSFAPPPAANRLDGQLHDFGHVVVFAVLGLFVARTMRQSGGVLAPRARAVVFTMALGLAFGALTEYAQQYLGGMLSRGDVARDVLGTAIGVCLALAMERTSAARVRVLLCAVAILGTTAGVMPLATTLLDYRARNARFPVLLDPAGARGLAFVGRDVLPLEVLPLPPQVNPTPLEDGATHAIAAYAPRPLGLRRPLDEGPWPGARLEEPRPDWRGFERIVVDLANPGDEPLRLAFRVNDRMHDNRFEDRFNAEIELPPRTRRRVAFPIAEIESAPRGRRMDLTDIERIVVFHPGSAPRREFYLLKLELER